MKKPVLITGGAGFLGTNIAATLAERGDNVLIFDALVRPRVDENLVWLKETYPERIEVQLGDVRNSEAVNTTVERAGAVINLAAQVAVTTSLVDPIADFEVNARGTLNVLEAVRTRNPEAPVLFASTNKVYGKLLEHSALVLEGRRYAPRDVELRRGFSEQTPLSFYSPYGCSKGAADQYVLDYARVFSLKTAVFRMSCLYGPHQYGHEDQGWVAHFLISALSGSPLTLYGDGCQVRDVLFVDDAVRPYLMALDQPERFAGQVFNLGGGPKNTTSLLELIEQIEKMTGHSLSHRFADWRPGDQAWYVSDTSALEKASGWRAQVDMEQGLKALWQWLKRADIGAGENKRSAA